MTQSGASRLFTEQSIHRHWFSSWKSLVFFHETGRQLFFTLESITHTHTHTQLLALLVLYWRDPHALTLLSQQSSVSPTQELPRGFRPCTRSVPLSVITVGPFPARGGRITANEITAAQPHSHARTALLLGHLGLGWMFHISELWALDAAGQMFHDSFWIHSPVKPRQPKRRNFFFLLYIPFPNWLSTHAAIKAQMWKGWREQCYCSAVLTLASLLHHQCPCSCRFQPLNPNSLSQLLSHHTMCLSWTFCAERVIIESFT